MNIDPMFASRLVDSEGNDAGRVSFIDSTTGDNREITLQPDEQFVTTRSDDSPVRMPQIVKTMDDGTTKQMPFSEYVEKRDAAAEKKRAKERGGGVISSLISTENVQEPEVAEISTGVPADNREETLPDPMDAIQAKFQLPPEVKAKAEAAFNYEGTAPAALARKTDAMLEQGIDPGFNVRAQAEAPFLMYKGSSQPSLLSRYLKHDIVQGAGLEGIDEADQLPFAVMVNAARSIGFIVEDLRVIDTPQAEATYASFRLPNQQEVTDALALPVSVLPNNESQAVFKDTASNPDREQEHIKNAALFFDKFRSDFEDHPERLAEHMVEVTKMAEQGELVIPTGMAERFGMASFYIQIAKVLGYELGETINDFDPSNPGGSANYRVKVNGYKKGYKKNTSSFSMLNNQQSAGEQSQ